MMTPSNSHLSAEHALHDGGRQGGRYVGIQLTVKDVGSHNHIAQSLAK